MQKLTDLAGLHKRSPFLAGCLAVFILSLAGIPPLAGFFGKFAVFASVLRLGVQGPVGWLTILAIALSAVALYYYLLILKQALVANHLPTDAQQSVGQTPGGHQPTTAPADIVPVRAPLPARIALLVAAGLIVALGLMPSLVLGLF